MSDDYVLTDCPYCGAPEERFIPPCGCVYYICDTKKYCNLATGPHTTANGELHQGNMCAYTEPLYKKVTDD